jgi:hypothetical protein
MGRGNESQTTGYRRHGGGKALLLVLLILILIAGSVGVTFTLARSSAPFPPKGSITATASLTTPLATATTSQPLAAVSPTASTSLPTPIATVTGQATLQNPYPPFTGTLVLNDSLKDNSKGYSWEEGTRDQGTCTFTQGAYQADIPLAGYFHSCLAMSPNFKNFAFEVQMTLVSSSAGGIVFRANRATTHLYYFDVNRNGGYLLKAYYDKVEGPLWS